MSNFPAFIITKTEDKPAITRTELTENDLMEGDVTVRVEYSALNYKDALAMTNTAPIIRHFPLIPGIDFAGTVTHSDNERFKPGDAVILNGYGIGETHSGGYAGLARVKSDWLVSLPYGMTTRQAMAIGTAGYTAMLPVLALERHGVKPGGDEGNVLVTGAAGGVGSIAVSVLSKLGYTVTATTGRLEETPYLEKLGASEVLDRNEFSTNPRPLARERWLAAVDVAGGNTLANVISQIKTEGAVAACGLADSMDLPTSVAPFILRGVTLYGINSVTCPMERRVTAWNRLVSDLDSDALEAMSNEISLDELPEMSEKLLNGQVRGRTIVKIPEF